MRIQTFAETFYQGCSVYVRNFHNHFEYFTVIRGRLYTAHITVRPTLRNRVLYFLKLRASRYTQDEINASVAYMKGAAHVTIETILKEKKNA